MNENTEFDLEWAKRGGVFVALDNQVPHHFAFFGFTCDVVVKRSIKKIRGYVVGGWRTFSESYAPTRMATRAECEAAGVEYIERPVSTEDIEHIRGIEYARGFDDGFRKNQQETEELKEELHDANEMLEYILRSNGSVALLGTGEFGFYENAFSIEKRTGTGKTPREATRAAMKGEKNE